MGLLDEAIKEHLELKRRHGADPGEVARLEHEALGPARRDPAPAAMADEPVAAPEVPEPSAQDPYLEDEGGIYDEVTAEERLDAPIHHVEPKAVEPDPVEEPEPAPEPAAEVRSEEHTSELQSPCKLVCRLLLGTKKAHPDPRRRRSLPMRSARLPGDRCGRARGAGRAASRARRAAGPRGRARTGRFFF